MAERRVHGSRQSTRERSSLGASAAAEVAVATTVVRRLGYVAVKAHEALMSNLIHKGCSDVAEAFNDAFKPLVDAMLNFEMHVGAGEEWNDETDAEV